MQSPALAGWPRVALIAAILAGASFVAFACDPLPTDTEARERLEPEVAVYSLADSDDPSICGTGKKSLEATVTLPGGTAAEGTVMSVTDVDDGLICWDVVDASGFAEVTNLEKDQEILVFFRPQIGPDFPFLEIWPPEPALDFATLDLDTDVPDPAVAPRMLSGEDCTEQSDFRPTVFYDPITPCVVPGPGFDVSVQLDNGNSASYDVSLIGPDGEAVPNALVGAVTPLDCDMVTDSLGGVCLPQNVQGPGFFQATAFTDASGSAELVVADGNAIAFEAVWSQETSPGVLQTLVASGAPGTTALLSHPFICEKFEQEDPGAGGAVDFSIEKVTYGYGGEVITEPADGFYTSRLEWVKTKGVVILEMLHTSDTPEAGVLKFRFRDGGTRTASVDFGVDTDGCYLGPISGNGADEFGLTVQTDACRKIGSQDGADRYEFIFEVDGLPDPDEWTASFYARTDGDKFDPARSTDVYSAGYYELFTPDSTDDGQCIWDASNYDGSPWRIL